MATFLNLTRTEYGAVETGQNFGDEPFQTNFKNFFICTVLSVDVIKTKC